MRLTGAIALGLLAGGCAGVDGHTLVPGISTEAEVLALMGEPAQRLRHPDGDSVLYFSQLPMGRNIYAVTLGPDGRVKSVEPRLTRQGIARIAVGATTCDDVRDLVGPPYRTVRAALKPLDVWEYPWRDGADKRILWVSFSDDCVAREVIDMRDYSDEPSGRPRNH